VSLFCGSISEKFDQEELRTARICGERKEVVSQDIKLGGVMKNYVQAKTGVDDYKWDMANNGIAWAEPIL
jgi:hypothetical protein